MYDKTFKYPIYVPQGLEVFTTFTPYVNMYGWLVELSLLQDDIGSLILCQRTRAHAEYLRKEILKMRGMPKAHTALYVYLTEEEIRAFKNVVRSSREDSASVFAQNADTFLNGLFHRIGYTELNETQASQLYAIATFGLDDELISYNRLFYPYDTAVSVRKILDLYSFTSENELKKLQRKLKKN